MKIIIQSLHFTASQDLSDFVTESLNKLDHFYDKIESASVALKLENSDSGENKVCEIRLAVPGNDLFAKRNNNSFEAAVADAVDALQQQIRKIKTKSENLAQRQVDATEDEIA